MDPVFGFRRLDFRSDRDCWSWGRSLTRAGSRELLDHLVGLSLERQRHGNAERLRRVLGAAMRTGRMLDAVDRRPR